ncbi:phosphonate ABC transporter ATP-binding protein [Mycoplasma phocoeninasale]|uniref:ATP-binding cassette domain-containing protein n=1 Tax=Mycoplasma phocoeninasale TaxID=2726117 RepID=A0A858U4W7_9MOLU|nr:ATP-binding cassette domain-containing protein [Mycoplasma phocoeninasale]MBN0970587.1 ATP-binding cassette domain-containing protein [Mycoplasma phocoeninasale]QJG66295.1 ATP-binding cassette domain-containing protein [Mycoplasma phocoeninasale]
MTKIEFRDVNANYKNSKQRALEGVNFSIEEGEMVAIIGPSGAGKSTIFNSILKQLHLISGQILIDNQDIFSLKKKQWKRIIRKIGFLSQEPNVIEDLNVYENILHFYSKYKNFVFALLKILDEKQKIEVYEVLNRLGIFEKCFTKVSELSGGQKQRLQIAQLLLQDVSIILADEPTSNLDIQTASNVLEILSSISKQYHKTILVNIHDLTLIKKYFKRYIFVREGEIIEIDNTSNLTKAKQKKLYS